MRASEVRLTDRCPTTSTGRSRCVATARLLLPLRLLFPLVELVSFSSCYEKLLDVSRASARDDSWLVCGVSATLRWMEMVVHSKQQACRAESHPIPAPATSLTAIDPGFQPNPRAQFPRQKIRNRKGQEKRGRLKSIQILSKLMLILSRSILL